MTSRNPLFVDIDQAGRIAGERADGYAPPRLWTPEHVDVRLTEAFEVLMCIPMTAGPKRFGNAMPSYLHDISDLQAQAESGELAKAQKHAMRRRGVAQTAEISRMEDALGWPLRYLKTESALAKAVAWSCFRKAVKREDGKLHRALGVSRRTFFRYRIKGLQIIANGLNSHRVLVT